jgi:hypothetical protein
VASSPSVPSRKCVYSPADSVNLYIGSEKFASFLFMKLTQIQAGASKSSRINTIVPDATYGTEFIGLQHALETFLPRFVQDILTYACLFNAEHPYNCSIHRAFYLPLWTGRLLCQKLPWLLSIKSEDMWGIKIR